MELASINAQVAQLSNFQLAIANPQKLNKTAILLLIKDIKLNKSLTFVSHQVPTPLVKLLKISGNP